MHHFPDSREGGLLCGKDDVWMRSGLLLEVEAVIDRLRAALHFDDQGAAGLDLVNEIDRDTECLPADAEAHEMEVFGHQTDPLNLVAGGCGHGITSITPISTITATSLLTIQAMRSERLKNEAIHRFEQSAGHLRHLIGRSGQLG